MKKFVNVRGRETKKARVEIIPMIDAIFFLLVFFMYSSLSMVKMRGMGVSVPKLSNLPQTQQTKPPKRYIVTVDKDGQSFLNLDPVPLDQMEARLQGYINNDPEGTIVVNVHKKQPVQKLVEVMDAVNNVKTPKGEPAGVIIATTVIDPKKEAAQNGVATGTRKK